MSASYTYAVGREKVREYALSVGETNPLYLDLPAAREAGYEDLVAPPMFAAVYCRPALAPMMLDPEVGIDYSRMVHGAQEFQWGALVVAGDEITTVVDSPSVSERGGLGFFVFESRSDNHRGERVNTGKWTMVVRGE